MSTGALQIAFNRADKNNKQQTNTVNIKHMRFEHVHVVLRAGRSVEQHIFRVCVTVIVS